MTTKHSNRPSGAKEQREWDAGYAFGYHDDCIPYWRRSACSRWFLLGYEAGKAQINREVEEAWERNQRYGEWL